MLKKWISALTLLCALTGSAQTEWHENITMLVVPRDIEVVQIAQDISRRYPVLLVCYQQHKDQVKIDAWNGEQWVPVSTNDYVDGTFFTRRPKHAILIEDENLPANEILIPDGTWCETGNKITSTNPRVVIHLLGRYFEFPYRYWMQFSRRYDYAVEDINPALLNIYWWNYRGDQVFEKRANRDFELDMDKWLFLNILSPDPIEPVEIEVEPAELPPAETPAQEPLMEEAESTNSISDVAAVMPDELQEEEDTPSAATEEEPPTADPFGGEEIPAAEVIPAA